MKDQLESMAALRESIGPDPSATALPVPPGAREGFNRGAKSMPWFGTGQQNIDVCYVADGRTAALGKLVAEGGAAPSVYGTWEDGILARPSPDGAPAARMVAGHWLSGPHMVGATLLSRALDELLPVPEHATRQLRIDDRAALGRAGPVGAAAIDPLNWEVAVNGELMFPGIAEQLALRPALVARAEDTLQIIEPGTVLADDADADRHVLTLQVRLAPDGQGVLRAGLPEARFDCAVALLLDEKIDGAWERAAPLWLPTTSGMLRIGQRGQEGAPYLFFSESRSIDVRPWFPALGGGAGARLMLDQSGKKTLTARRDGAAVVLTLSVLRPALVLVLPGMAVDGRGLAAPDLPPGPDALARAAPLQLVPLHLCGDAASCWTMHYAGGLQLQWTRPADDTDDTGGAAAGATLTHFTGHANWVLPPEAARNGPPGISVLRTLLPMLPDGDVQRFGIDAIVGNGIGAMRLAPTASFGAMAADATAFGPLASFDGGGGPDREMWEAAATPSAEPAVLRSVYRQLPAAVLPGGAPALFEATRVRAAGPAPDAGPAPLLLSADDAAAGHGWARHPADGRPRRRYEARAGWPGPSFGWETRLFTAGAALVRDGAAAPNQALAWSEVRALEDGSGNFEPARWIRLSDDSLKRLAGVPAPSRQAALDALLALSAQPVVLDGGSLAETAAQGRWGLAHLRVVETVDGGAGTLSLKIGDGAHDIALGQRRGVNRIVVAHAVKLAVVLDIAPAVRTVVLNRVYLELERRGGRLVVARGMLGWGADQAFGCDRMSAAGQDSAFHVTERFERVGGALERSVEYNGALSRPIGDGQHAVDLYFWDCLQTPDAATLRVICNYRLMVPGADQPTSICALQDAALRGDALDLSADIAILQTSPAATNARLPYPWDPDRRKLYRLLFDTAPDPYRFAGFLRVRGAATDSVRTPFLGPTDEARVIPAWYLCDRDLVGWFDADSGAAPPARQGWTAAGLLRSGAAADAAIAAGAGLALELSAIEALGGTQYYASTLIGAGGMQAGLPLWVPSPVRVPPPADVLAPRAVGAADTQIRLWLFNPGPRMVAQWAAPIADGAAPAARQAAIEQALQRLWRMGWTREAVLQLPIAGQPDEVEWIAVDSPLQNRGASLAWFGWPLAPDAQFPRDELPLSEQLPTASGEAPAGFCLQVAFDTDAAAGQPRLELLDDAAYPGLAAGLPDGLTVRSAGLRVGVVHKLVAYAGAAPAATVQPAPLARPAVRPGPALRVDGGQLAWHGETVDLAREGLSALPGGEVLLALPYPCSELRIDGAPPALQYLNAQSVWADLADGAWLAPSEKQALRLKLPPPARWSALALTLRAADAPALADARTLFASGGTRMAGVFDDDGKLLAFGEEQAYFVAPADAVLPATGSTVWTRNGGVALPAAQAAAAVRVVTIDLDGVCVESRLAVLP